MGERIGDEHHATRVMAGLAMSTRRQRRAHYARACVKDRCMAASPRLSRCHYVGSHAARLHRRGSLIVEEFVMSRSIFALATLTAAALSATAGLTTASAGEKPGEGDTKLIESAMQAAPAKVASNATVVAMQTDGTTRTVRAGNNGFTCMADSPATPGPDPMCMDAAALEWAHAWIGHKAPPSGKVGFMYMLAGGTDASNTDPYATKPTANNHWVETGPHVMIVGADASFYDMYPKNADPDTSVPYVMWSGTPYQHLMVPVK
jgi:hypothetical protein